MVKNLDRVLARLARIPERVKAAAEPALEAEVEKLVQAQKRNAPRSDDASGNPSHLADSIRKYRNPDRPLSWRIIADAKDDQGHFIGSNIEQGHRTASGTHVPGAHFFFAIYRALKRPMRRRLLKVTRDVTKTL